MTTSEPLSLLRRFDLPDTRVARHAYAFAARATAPFILNHSVRSYIFARSHAAHRGLTSGSDYDDELLFLSCVLHDVGLSEEGNGDQRFEVDGADTAAALLREYGMDERRIEIVWDAIALHTSQGIAERKGAEVALSQAGIATDILGAQREILQPGLADEVHALLPRENLGYALTDAIVDQALANPRKANPLTFPGQLLRLHLPHGAIPDWYQVLGQAGWGDKPLRAAGRCRAETPEQAAVLFMEYLAARDLEGLVSLYEPDAHFVPEPGVHATGEAAIRQALQNLLDSGAGLTLEPRDSRIVGDIALMSNTATLSPVGSPPVISDTTEVLRRQPDGTWAYVVDDPFFS